MKTIVVLGAGVGATPLIRQLMRNTVLTSNDYRMVVIAPNTHFHWPIAIPRAVVPGQLPDEKVSIALEPYFKDYPKDKFEFVLGTASGLDPDTKSVIVALNTGGSSTVSYHTIVIATGTTSKNNMPWKGMRTTEETKTKLHNLQDSIKEAKTIVVAGGGLTGSETAGELGFEYAQSGKKEVIFVYSDSLPLAAPVIDSVRKQVSTELEKLNVKLVPDTTVTAVSTSGKDTILELHHRNGTTRTITTQAYLPTTGATPNSSFAPPKMLDSDGYLKQTTTLQAEGYPDVFVLGDVGNLEGSNASAVDAQTVHLIMALPTYLNGGKLPEFQAATRAMYGITLGRSRATGQVGNFKMFSFVIWYIKGRFLGTDYAHLIAAGKKTMLKTYEK